MNAAITIRITGLVTGLAGLSVWLRRVHQYRACHPEVVFARCAGHYLKPA
ncbi:hypothetical protein [Geoglobus acetivorans]|uniref:Uncharacterized protein n=1 Tax=Geoglobus acetivorans TaxID=565033 RepID=A0ABZ3H0R5_GEOAI|nr:hypothetical protein [Geoglobus acetivorans]